MNVAFDDTVWSTRELIGDGCDVVARFRNTAFGLASPASSPSWSDLSSAQWSVMSVEDWNHLPVMDSGGPFGFGGQSGYYYDPETNLYLLGGGGRGRYYDPQLARFQNPDPTGIASGDPNLYRYVVSFRQACKKFFAAWISGGLLPIETFTATFGL